MECKKPAQDFFMIAKCFSNRLPYLESGICSLILVTEQTNLYTCPGLKAKCSTFSSPQREACPILWGTDGSLRTRSCPLVHVQMTSVPLHQKEVTGLPFAPGDRQRDFPVDLYKVMFSEEDTRQLLGRSLSKVHH